ncbi:MAG TPA: hypothetical protein DEF51_09700 [Myxococcales bacterium]|nr:hypothetical protein [Myxococcales bacterium]
MTKRIQPRQGTLVPVDRMHVVDNIEMGVTEDGTPFLTQRGLARLCHVRPSVITEWAAAYDPDSTFKRDRAITRALVDQGYSGDLYYKLPDGSHAYPDAVCMAVLEWYAFDANAPGASDALANYRILSRAGLRLFIYRKVGYDPASLVPPKWRQFHDRMELNAVPKGYFSVFREIAGICIEAIHAGLVMDSSTIPDISVGNAWAAYWRENDLESVYGPRRKHPHTYPDYFPQSSANAFIEANIYPLDALPVFLRWLDEEYLPHRYPAYLATKVAQGALPADSRDLLLAAFNDDSETAE